MIILKIIIVVLPFSISSYLSKGFKVLSFVKLPNAYTRCVHKYGLIYPGLNFAVPGLYTDQFV